MDPESLANSTKKVPRKVKFAPKGPPRRAQKPVVPKVEKVEEDTDAAAQEQELLRRFNESSLNQKPKAERKGEARQVAFGYAGSSSSLKSQGGFPGVGNYHSAHPPTGGDSDNKPEKEYKEPWDYYSYYPTTLPQRRPYSGNPEVLDEEEFGEDAEGLAYDENSTKPAVKLGLMEENMEQRLLLFQFPAKMPIVKEQQSKAAESKEASNNSESSSSKGVGARQKVYNFHELPAGFMGKLLVYKSGAVKLKLGDALFEVSDGVDSSFAQDVVAVNKKEKICCSVGELNQCAAVVTPDADPLLDCMLD